MFKLWSGKALETHLTKYIIIQFLRVFSCVGRGVGCWGGVRAWGGLVQISPIMKCEKIPCVEPTRSI